MRGKLVIAVALLVAGVTAGAIVVGPEFLEDRTENGTTSEPVPTETTTTRAASKTEGGTVGGVSDGGRETTPTSENTPTAIGPFAFEVVSVEDCGSTCRDVTISLTNRQQRDAENVTVYARIFAGRDSEGDGIWAGTEQVGRLAPGESVTATKRVSLSFMDALAVQQADGWVTIQTTVESDSETMTFTEQRDVA